MKKTLLLIVCFCTFICISCKKIDYTIDYKTSISYKFSNAESQTAVSALINSYSNIWLGTKTYTDATLDGTDKQALSDFGNAVSSINSHFESELLPYFEPNDTIIYVLQRTTTGYSGTVKKVQYTIDGYMPL